MVADADGSNVRPVSDRHVTLATPCWSPDDRFIRAEGVESGGNRTVVLLPLDGSPPVDIPALGGTERRVLHATARALAHALQLTNRPARAGLPAHHSPSLVRAAQ